MEHHRSIRSARSSTLPKENRECFEALHHETQTSPGVLMVSGGVNARLHHLADDERDGLGDYRFSKRRDYLPSVEIHSRDNRDLLVTFVQDNQLKS